MSCYKEEEIFDVFFYYLYEKEQLRNELEKHLQKFLFAILNIST